MAESDAFPPSQPAVPTAQAAAEAALKTVLDNQRAEAEKKIAASEIIDPDAKPQRYTEREAKPEEKPALVEGASTGDDVERQKLIDRALAIDIPLEDAQKMSQPTLRRIIAREERRRAEPEPKFEQRTEPQWQPEEEEFTLPEIASETPDVEIEPGLKKALTERDKLLLAQRKEIAELKRAQQEQQYREQVRQIQSNHKSFEKQIAADTDLHDVLGDGKGPPDDPQQLKACQKLWKRVEAIMMADGGTVEDAYQEARAGMFREQLSHREGKKLSDKVEAQAKQFSRAPAGSKPKEMPFGKERAEAAVAQALAGRK